MICHRVKCRRRASYLPIIAIVTTAFLDPLFYIEISTRPTCQVHIKDLRELTDNDLQTCKTAFQNFVRQKGLLSVSLNEAALKIEYKKVKFH